MAIKAWINGAALCLLLSVGCGLSSCWSLWSRLPPAADLPQRVAEFPNAVPGLREPVRLRWSEDLLPFIEARNDHDLALVMGMVHGHLRLGQMELLRRASAGRLAEGFGPLASDLDVGLRMLDLGAAVPAMLDDMPPQELAWLEAFCAGINHSAQSQTLPIEFQVMAVEFAPWTPADVLRLGRLAAIDINWFTWLASFDAEERLDAAFRQRLSDHGIEALPSSSGGFDLASLLVGHSRSGSNAVALAASRSAGPGALVAYDPHLALTIPNTWLLIGWSTPQQRVTGLSIPGIPMLGVGRSEHLAWGGTNMRTWSSDLYRLGPEEAEQISEESQKVVVRWWQDRRFTLRRSPWGPIINDLPRLGRRLGDEPLALRWLGHEPSQEIAALRGLAAAESIEAAHAALRGYRVSGQTMLIADTQGAIAQVLMTGLPRRHPDSDERWLRQAGEASDAWQGIIEADELPLLRDPAAGWLASANNPPYAQGPRLGWYADSAPRMQRLAQLLDAGQQWTLDELAQLQLDVRDPLAPQLLPLLLAAAPESPEPPLDEVLQRMQRWSGDYQAELAEPWWFEHLLSEVVERGYGRLYGSTAVDHLQRAPQVVEWLLQDLSEMDEDWAADIAESWRALARAVAADPEATWGDRHRLHLSHPFARIPVVGGRYRTDKFAAAGGNRTINKTGNSLSRGEHQVTYGANARFLADMGDIDSARGILLGGQDGRQESAATWSHSSRWFAGESIPLPLSPQGVAAQYPYIIDLKP